MLRRTLARTLFVLAAANAALTGCGKSDSASAPAVNADRLDKTPEAPEPTGTAAGTSVTKEGEAPGADLTAQLDEVAKEQKQANAGAATGVVGQGAGGGYAAPKSRVKVAAIKDGSSVGDGSAESYTDHGVNAWTDTATDHLSTFAADVDTASFTIVRRKLAEGALPPTAAVRVEEFVNYFGYGYAAPDGARPFAVHMDAAPSPFNPGRQIVRVGVTTKAKARSERKAANLVFLVDVSGSMNGPDRIELAKRSLRILVDNLADGDTVSLVTYAGSTRVVLEPTGLDGKDRILGAIEDLTAGGSTAMASGLELAYQQAAKLNKGDVMTRVIVLSDGDANVGNTSHEDMLRSIEGHVKEGITLSTIGFGMGNYKDSTLESLADRGNGAYAYIDTIGEARKVLIEEAGGTFLTIAKDVKIQLELNPAEVSAYRLIGYENRMLADTDFVDDTVDAGEIGAGHTVTALYELVPADGGPGAPTIPLRYGAEPGLTPAAGSGELFTIKVRYKEPTGSVSRELVRHVPDEALPADRTSERFRFSAAVASFGMLLRGSEHAGAANYRMVRALAESALGGDARGYRREFLGLVATAEKLAGGTPAVAR